MTTRHTLTPLAVIAALHGTNAVSDTNGIPPYYDVDTDTVVYHHAGRRSMQATAMMGAPE